MVTLLRPSQARECRAIYDAVKTPRSDVDYSRNPPPRSSVRGVVRTACTRTQAHPELRFPCTCPCGSANGHRLMIYRVLYYACFAFVIKYIHTR